MIRIKMEKRSKRERTENWTDEERNLLRNLVNERFDIIENKNNDSVTNMQKLEAWKYIWGRFILLNQRPRTVQKLREQWKRMKLQSRIVKDKVPQEKDDVMEQNYTQTADPTTVCGDTSCGDVYTSTIHTHSSIENGIPTIGQTDYKYAKESIMNPSKPRNITSRMYQSKGGVEYKRSLLELNRVVKEQLTNCALEEHRLRMQQLKEEHRARMDTARETHALQSQNLRLQAELLRLEIEAKRKQLNDYVI